MQNSSRFTAPPAPPTAEAPRALDIAAIPADGIGHDVVAAGRDTIAPPLV